MLSVLDDLRFAARRLRARPGWTAAATAAFALGIACNAVLYGAAGVLLFRPLAIPDQDRIVAAPGLETGRRAFRRDVSAADSSAFLKRSSFFPSLTAAQTWTANLSGGGGPFALPAFEVSPGDPAVFTGVPPALAVTALAACLFPALRALRTDPVKALRHE